MNKESWFDLRPGEDTRMFRFSKASTPGLGPTTHRPIQWVPLASSLAVTWARVEAEHSNVSNAEVKDVWSHIFTFPICLHNRHRTSLTVHFQDGTNDRGIRCLSWWWIRSRSEGCLHIVIVENCSNSERETKICEVSSWRQNSGSPLWV